MLITSPAGRNSARTWLLGGNAKLWAKALGLLLLMAGLGSMTGSAAHAAQNVGVAAAVLPQARSAQPNQEARVLRIGVDIVANERVVTDANGKLQLLFLDGSALTVGPNSDVVVDEFVYNPKAKTGKLAFSATKGLFRLVGGRISKTTPVLLKTPHAVIGIRGGIVTAHASDAGVKATFHFGDQMTVESGGKKVAADRPGFQISAQGGKAPEPPVPASEQELSAEMNSLESGPEQSDEGKVDVGDEDVSNTQLAALGSEEPPVVLLVGDKSPLLAPINDTFKTDDKTDTTAAQQQMATQDSSAAGLTLSGFYGRGKRGTSTSTGTSDADSTQNVALSALTIDNGRFTATSSQGRYDLQGPSTTGLFTLSGTNTTPYGNVTGTGFLSGDSQFLLYELAGSQQFIFAGVPTPNSAVPTSGLFVYEARNDFTLGGSNIPLIPAVHGGNLTPLTAAQAMIYWGASGAGSHPTFFSTTLAISGTGASQTYAFSLLVGEILTDGSGRPFLHGEGVGLSLTSATGDFYSYDGNIATQDAGNGSDFFGIDGPAYGVLGAEDVDASDNVIGRGVKESRRKVDATIYPNVLLAANESNTTAAGTRSTKVMAAYMGGVSRDFSAGGTFLGAHQFHSTNTTGTVVVDGVTVPINRIQTSAAFNNVEGAFNILSPFAHGVPATVLQFGGLSAALSENSSFIDDGHFAAIGFETVSPFDPQIGIFRNTDISISQMVPSGVTVCTCQYVSWGFWGAGVSPSTEHDIGLATWVAGERISSGNFHLGATGTYSGTVIGTVANGAHETDGGVSIYTAVGAYSFGVSIGSVSVSVTSGTMSIDGASMNFTATGSIASPTEFSGTLSGTRGGLSLTGTIAGSFFGTPATATSAPKNVAGYFYANDAGPTYQVSGVHFSELQP